MRWTNRRKGCVITAVMKRSEHPILLTVLISFSILFSAFDLPVRIVRAQVSIPARYDGFVYGDGELGIDTIMIEAFLDPLCPDSRDAWPPLKRALEYYGPLVSLIVHPFPLPYHDNSFISCRALHIVNNLNSSDTYRLLEMFFQHQEKFGNQRTHSKSRAFVVSEVVKFVAKTIGSSFYSDVEAGFSDRQTDLKARVSFKHGCLRGVYGTPFFFVNGFPLPDAGSAIDYNGWRSILDPLIGKQGLRMDESYFSTT